MYIYMYTYTYVYVNIYMYICLYYLSKMSYSLCCLACVSKMVRKIRTVTHFNLTRCNCNAHKWNAK